VTVYRPEIDGLRAIAIIAVLFFHLGLGCPGGYIGVDVFFVISGYLITGIIQRGLESGRFTLADFWERRIRRIYPAFAVMMITTLLVGSWLLLPNEIEELAKSAVAQLCMVGNVYFWRDTGYFAGPAEFKPLLHSWSLAVEEQFYLFFPIALMLLRVYKISRPVPLLLSVAFLSLVISAYGAIFRPSPTFYLLPTRAWELLVGCLLAFLPEARNGSVRRDAFLGAAGLLAILLPVFLFSPRVPFPGLAALPPVFGAAAIIRSTAGPSKTWLHSGLSFKPLVFIGLISYSLYLWHWPVIVFTRTVSERFGWYESGFALLVSVGLAFLSYRYVETPFRNKKYLANRKRLFKNALASSGLIAIMGFGSTKVQEVKYPNYRSLQEDLTWMGGEVFTPPAELDFDSLPVLGIEPTVGERLDFLLWGDSHAAVLCEVISKSARRHRISGKAICTYSQVPFLDVCTPMDVVNGDPALEIRFRSEIEEIIRKRRPKNLVIAARWSLYTDGYSAVDGRYEGSGHLHSNVASGSVTEEGNLEVLAAGFARLQKVCAESGVTLWVMSEVPEVGGSTPARDAFLVACGRRSKLPNYPTNVEQWAKRQEQAKKIFQVGHLDAEHLIDPTSIFVSDHHQIVFESSRSLYRDNDHLTRSGASKMSDFFDDLMINFQSDATN
jgi:peptidoglycan/LPS O-acetylase OafA/YrhL